MITHSSLTNKPYNQYLKCHQETDGVAGSNSSPAPTGEANSSSSREILAKAFQPTIDYDQLRETSLNLLIKKYLTKPESADRVLRKYKELLRVEDFLNCLDQTNNNLVKVAIMWALVKKIDEATPTEKANIGQKIQQYTQPNVDTALQLVAAQALAKLGKKDEAEQVIDRNNRRAIALRGGALQWLPYILLQEALVAAGRSKEAMQNLYQHFIDHDASSFLQVKITDCLSRFAEKENIKATNTLLKLLTKYSDTALLLGYVNGQRKNPDSQIEQTLVEAIEKDNEDQRRIFCIGGLILSGGELAKKTIMNIIRNPDADEDIFSATVFYYLQYPPYNNDGKAKIGFTISPDELEELLIEYAGSVTKDDLKSVIKILGNVKCPTAETKLLDILDRPPAIVEPSERTKATVLYENKDLPEITIEESTLHALGKCQDSPDPKRLASSLLPYLSSLDQNLTLSAIDSLSRAGVHAKPHLEQLFSTTPNENIKMAAGFALMKIHEEMGNRGRS